MKLYLMRHGDYIAHDIRQENPLSEKGVSDIQHLAHFLTPCQLTVDHIYHSPKRRALQTAELISQGFICPEPIQLYAQLNPTDDIDALFNDLLAWEEDILIVGHLPYLSKLASKLLVNDENKEIIAFQTGTLVSLERVDQTHWIINWALEPSLFVHHPEN